MTRIRSKIQYVLSWPILHLSTKSDGNLFCAIRLTATRTSKKQTAGQTAPTVTSLVEEMNVLMGAAGRGNESTPSEQLGIK